MIRLISTCDDTLPNRIANNPPKYKIHPHYFYDFYSDFIFKIFSYLSHYTMTLLDLPMMDLRCLTNWVEFESDLNARGYYFIQFNYDIYLIFFLKLEVNFYCIRISHVFFRIVLEHIYLILSISINLFDWRKLYDQNYLSFCIWKTVASIQGCCWIKYLYLYDFISMGCVGFRVKSNFFYSLFALNILIYRYIIFMFLLLNVSNRIKGSSKRETKTSRSIKLCLKDKNSIKKRNNKNIP